MIPCDTKIYCFFFLLSSSLPKQQRDMLGFFSPGQSIEGEKLRQYVDISRRNQSAIMYVTIRFRPFSCSIFLFWF